MRLLDFALAAAVVLSAVCAPYTKVEESFFMQAVHDILKWGRVNNNYDHLEFPGVVPRSFVGPLIISALTYPAKLLYGNQAEGIAVQISARIVLGWLVVWANSQLRQEISSVFGSRSAMWYGVFCLCQFHYTFWTSRMLGNTLALVPMLIAHKLWLRCIFSNSDVAAQRNYCKMAIVLAFTCTVLRFDTAVFAASMLASKIGCITRRTVATFFATVTTSAVLSIAIDSYYWQQKWMWPEFNVFWFNVVQGRSSEWGISPPHYYFTHFIPRLLLGAFPFACIGVLVDSRSARLAMACFAAVGVFSANAHKEWRFILPAVPIFNMYAGIGVSKLYQVARIRQLVALTATLAAALSLVIAATMTFISSYNYPGGHALALLHAIEPSPNVSVHIDTFSAMTGVCRFGQLRADWVYDKSEGLDLDQFGNFTHLLTSDPKSHMKHGFDIIGTQYGYSGIQLDYKQALAGQLPISVRQEPLVWIMRRVATLDLNG
ncbi:alpha-1,6- mannosyltransferase [Coemansia sp. RSA 720]|nr:alpha-1,6- mannosyltransferase [Coemansia sp. RSA 720]